MNKIAHYSLTKLILYIFAWLAACVVISLYPYARYGGIGEAIQSSRVGWIMLVGVISSFIMIILIIIFTVCVLIVRGTALYQRDGFLISSAPFTSRIDIKNIKDIYFSGDKSESQICIELKSGKIRTIHVFLFRESGSALINVLRGLN